MNESLNMEHWRSDTDKDCNALRKKPVPVPLCPPQIQYGMAWDQTWASTVTDQQLTALAMAQHVTQQKWYLQWIASKQSCNLSLQFHFQNHAVFLTDVSHLNHVVTLRSEASHMTINVNYLLMTHSLQHWVNNNKTTCPSDTSAVNTESQCYHSHSRKCSLYEIPEAWTHSAQKHHSWSW